MTTGYLWTGQYPECEVCTTEGRPHSMELDEDTLQGHWAEGDNSSMELFIVTDAIFSKLCILGEDVEPCFEGSEIISPNISQNFTYTQAFKKSLFTIMQEFNKVLQGGNSTMDEQNTAINDTIESTTPDSETQTDMPAAADTLDVFKKTDDKEEKENTDKENKEEKDEEEEKEKKSSKHSLDDITDKFSILQRQYEDLVKQNTELMEFQKATISEKKQGIVDKFTMLSDEEKAPIIAEMENFSIKELEKEFYAVLGKKEFSRLNKIEKEVENNNTVATPTTTFNLDSNADASIPAWIKAIENVHKNNI